MRLFHLLRLLIAGLLLGAWACSSPAPPTALAGRWRYSTPEDINYPELIFQDSTLILTSRADTLYRFQFHLDSEQQVLQLTDGQGKQWRVNILKANADSLVLDNLHEKAGVQRYRRIPEEAPNLI